MSEGEIMGVVGLKNERLPIPYRPRPTQGYLSATPSPILIYIAILQEILQRCWATDPTSRPSTDELLQGLHKL
jgi:hypothetical protein